MADNDDYEGGGDDSGAGNPGGGSETHEVKTPHNGVQRAVGDIQKIAPVLAAVLNIVSEALGCGNSNDPESHVEYGDLPTFDVYSRENWSDEQRQAVQDLQDAANALNGDFSNLSAINPTFENAATAFSREDLAKEFNEATQKAQDHFNSNENSNDQENEQEHSNEQDQDNYNDHDENENSY
ncbi:hypothetical protein HDU97_004774 [Phlyctochytrium planicorne]|nr:hypothetical protein HDU97_004774 [Phlyctochytrium planicorne]